MRAVVVLGLLLATPVLGSETLPLHRAQAPGHHPVECYCRAQGRMFAEGERVCLRTAQGPRLAFCDMETNVMSWSITETPCPES